MNHASIPGARRAFTSGFAVLCLGGLAAGIALCLLQGQGAKADRFAAAAHAYYAQSGQGDLSVDSVAYLRIAAREAAWQALSHDPARPATWALLSDIMLQSQSFAAAAQTASIAQNMGFERSHPESGFAAAAEPLPSIVRERR